MARISGEEREPDRPACDWPDLVQRHGPAAWRTAYRLLGNRADADECLQETFLTAFDVSRRESVANWQALIVRLATSRAIDRLRSRDRRRQREQHAVLQTIEPRSVPPYQNLLDEELAARLRLALAEIPPRQAEVFCLHCVHEWSYQQVADELGISVDVVGVLLHRARQRLRGLLAGFAPDAERFDRAADGFDPDAGRASAGAASKKENQ